MNLPAAKLSSPAALMLVCLIVAVLLAGCDSGAKKNPAAGPSGKDSIKEVMKPGDAPAVTDKPAEATDKPEPTDKPATTDKPAQSDKPADSAKPAPTDDPAPTNKPTAPDKPATTENPDEGAGKE